MMPTNSAVNTKPHVGARVSTKHRMIDGVVHEDTGIITRLEDGGHCVVKWDSDGESTSVVMMSLRPLADSPVNEARERAKLITKVNWAAYPAIERLIQPVPELLKALIGEVERLQGDLEMCRQTALHLTTHLEQHGCNH
jgi:hypothetical protein